VFPRGHRLVGYGCESLVPNVRRGILQPCFGCFDAGKVLRPSARFPCGLDPRGDRGGNGIC
jgi:hypothetical protein